MLKCGTFWKYQRALSLCLLDTAECFALGRCSAAGDQGHPHQQGPSDGDSQEVGGSRLHDGAVRRPRYASMYMVFVRPCTLVKRGRLRRQSPVSEIEAVEIERGCGFFQKRSQHGYCSLFASARLPICRAARIPNEGRCYRIMPAVQERSVAVNKEIPSVWFGPRFAEALNLGYLFRLSTSQPEEKL